MDDFLLTGLWEPGSHQSYVWYGADWDEFQTKAEQLKASGYILNSLDVDQSGDSAKWAGAWVTGTDMTQQLSSPFTRDELIARCQQLGGQGLQLTRLRSFGSGVPRWAGYWRSMATPTLLVIALEWPQFWSAWIEQHGRGNRLVDFDVSRSHPPLWSGLWEPGEGDQYLWTNASWSNFVEKDHALRSQQYRLICIRSYETDGMRAWAGVWRRSPPASSLVADLTVSQFWSEWTRQWEDGRCLARLHVWRGSGFSGSTGARARVKLHLKVVAEPTVPIQTMVECMRAVYEPAGILIDIGSAENLNEEHLLDVDVGACTQTTTTPEQEKLFGLRNSAGVQDIVVYFVRSTLPPYNGCAAHPSDRPGVIISNYATKWTMAHEVGHVLGLYHVSDARRLMTGNGTANIIEPPPDLIQSEIDTIIGSAYSRPVV